VAEHGPEAMAIEARRLLTDRPALESSLLACWHDPTDREFSQSHPSAVRATADRAGTT